MDAAGGSKMWMRGVGEAKTTLMLDKTAEVQ